METVKINIALMIFSGNLIERKEYHSVDTNKQVGTNEKSLKGVHIRPHWPPDYLQMKSTMTYTEPIPCLRYRFDRKNTAAICSSI